MKLRNPAYVRGSPLSRKTEGDYVLPMGVQPSPSAITPAIRIACTVSRYSHNLIGGQMFYVQHLCTLVPPTTCYELHLW